MNFHHRPSLTPPMRTNPQYTADFPASPGRSDPSRGAVLPDDTGNFRGVFDTSLAVAMSSRFSLTASLGYRYNSDPGGGLEKADLLFVTGIAVRME